MAGDQVGTESGANTDGAPTEETDVGPRWSAVNWAIIAVLTLLTLLSLALSTGYVGPVVEISNADSATIPLYVYLYSGFGALGYVFTKLMAELDQYAKWRNLERLVEMAMRIPAAWILSTGIYLFAGTLGGTSGTPDARLTAGAVFLVGLYVNVALKALGGMADRVLGRSPRGRT